MPEFLFKFPLLAKHLSKYYLKNKNGKNFVEKFEDIDLPYVLLPSINFLQSKHNRKLKIDPNCRSPLFCHCLQAAISHLLSEFPY